MLKSLLTATVAATAAAISCDLCELAVVGVVAEAGNSTKAAEVVQYLQQHVCGDLPTNGTLQKICDGLTEVVDLVPWLVKEMDTVAWPIPNAFCSVFVDACKQPCCTDPVIPEQVHLSLTGDMTEQAVTWVTLTNATGNGVVRWGTSATNLQYSAPASTRTYTKGGWVGVVHEGTMTGLSPNTQYYYVVGGGNAFSDIRTFTTFSNDIGTAARPLRILQVGDMGYSSVSNNTRNNMARLVEAGEVDLVLHTGDISYADAYMPHWDIFMREMEPVTSAVPYMTIAGNHEIWFNFTAYKTRFSMPGDAQSLQYSFNVGPVHITMMNTESPVDTPDIDNTEISWLKQDLAAANGNRAQQPWIIAAGHRPFYCTGNHRDCGSFADILRFQAENVLAKAQVDLVISSHVHSYERTWPVYAGIPFGNNYENPKVPVYVVNGAAGNREGNDTPSGDKSWSAAHSPSIGYAIITVIGDSLQYSFYDSATAALIDTFTITK